MSTPYERAIAAGDLDDRSGGRFWAGTLDRLRRRGTGRARRQVTTDNGSVANPIKGTKVSGATDVNGGAF